LTDKQLLNSILGEHLYIYTYTLRVVFIGHEIVQREGPR